MPTFRLPSFIWDQHHCWPLSTYPPGIGRATLTATAGAALLPVYLVFQPIRFTLMLHCCNKAWALTPRFHPYPETSGRYIFCGTCCSHGVQPQDLPVRKYGALCCPDFPYPRTCRDTIEQVVTMAKVRKIMDWRAFMFCPEYQPAIQPGRIKIYPGISQNQHSSG